MEKIYSTMKSRNDNKDMSDWSTDHDIVMHLCIRPKYYTNIDSTSRLIEYSFEKERTA